MGSTSEKRGAQEGVTLVHAQAEARRTDGRGAQAPGAEARGAEALSTPDLIRAILKDAGELVKTQIDLARTELRADLEAELKTAKGLGVAAVAALVAVNALVVTGILALATLMPGWLAGLLVSAVVLLVAAVAAALGWTKRVRAPLRRTRHELEEDVRLTRANGKANGAIAR